MGRAGVSLASHRSTITQVTGTTNWQKLSGIALSGHGIRVPSAHQWWKTLLGLLAEFRGQFMQEQSRWTRFANILWRCAGCGKISGRVCVTGPRWSWSGVWLVCSCGWRWDLFGLNYVVMSQILMNNYFWLNQKFLNITKDQEKVILWRLQVYVYVYVIGFYIDDIS